MTVICEDKKEEAFTMCSKDFWYASVDINVIRDRELSQTAKFVFSVLCSFITINNRNCWPSNETVAEAANVSKSTVKRAYRELEKRGVIARSKRFKDGAQTSSRTRIIGHDAPCYKATMTDEDTTVASQQSTDTSTPNSHVNHKGNQENNIKDSLKGEADLPDFTDIPLEETTYTSEKSQTRQALRSKNPKEAYTLEDAPDIMKTTAEFFLRKTGRQGLTWTEILALRKLAATQYPVRVQKEICTAVNRFLNRGQSLGTLTFGYIAGSLENQPTWGRKPRAKPKPLEVQPQSSAKTEALLAKIALLQAKFDAEAQL